MDTRVTEMNEIKNFEYGIFDKKEYSRQILNINSKHIFNMQSQYSDINVFNKENLKSE